MKACIYSRVSIPDQKQNALNQLVLLRQFALSRNWKVFNEYVDFAPATDFLHRKAWQQLLVDAGNKKFDIVLVSTMDRAFRSLSDAHNILEQLKAWIIELHPYSE